jgi:predicted glycosyltransferase
MRTRRGILIYCGDVVGLGHQRRNTAIAARLLQEMPGTDALLVSSLPAGAPESTQGVDLIKLPSLRKAAGGGFEAGSLGMQRCQVQRLRSGILAGIANEFRPDLVLVDHKPTGVWDELRPSLRLWRESLDGPCLVFGVRDIVDSPATTVRRWRRQGVYQTIEQYYDAVLIYGSQEIFDTRSRYRLDRECSVPVDYCGYVCPVVAAPGNDTVRRDLGLGTGRIAVVTVGGGTDGYAIIKLCLEALEHVDPKLGLRLVCVAGPFMNSEEVESLRRVAATMPACVVRFIDRLPALLGTADVVVTMAGYNTLLEATVARKPTIVLPRSGPSAEQSLRAERLARRGIVRTLHADERHPQVLAAAITQCLVAPKPPAEMPGMDGLERTVHRLCELLEQREQRRTLRRRQPWRVVAGGRQ